MKKRYMSMLALAMILIGSTCIGFAGEIDVPYPKDHIEIDHYDTPVSNTIVERHLGL